MDNLLGIFIFKCLIFVTGTGHINALSHRYSLVIPSNVKYGDINGYDMDMSALECLALCDGQDSCSSVNYNLETCRCELTPHLPRVQTPDITSETNWRVYYNDRFIPATSAWQKTTLGDDNQSFSASYAIDGDRENNDQTSTLYCAHNSDGYNYWAMELEYTATVDYVIIYFRNADSLNDRNEDLQLLISTTRDDSDNDIGTECATYPGPPATSALPVKIKCMPQVTGKFLKVRQNKNSYLTLCEVEAYHV